MSTNQAFINAYSTAPKKTASEQAITNPHEATLASSELVMASGFDDYSALEPPVESPREHHSKATRRPLSQVRADNLFGLRHDAAHTTASRAPQWPQACQRLLARSADKFDAVIRKLPAGAPQALIGLMGANAGSGCSTSAMCLALRCSALGFNTLLVDAKLSDRGLAPLLSVDDFTCWIDALEAGQSIESALIRGDSSGVDLLLAKPLKAGELDSAVQFRASLTAGLWRRKYHRVVIDFGSLTNQLQSTSIAELAACLGIDFLLATASPATTETDLGKAIESLDGVGLKLAGVIEATC